LVLGSGVEFHGIDASGGTPLEPAFRDATPEEIDAAISSASTSGWERSDREDRAALLEAIADEIEASGDALLERAEAETALPRGRLVGERGRTTGQLRKFAAVVREGSYLDLRIDPAQPERAPLPRADLRSMKRPIGPVAVFGASNFPLAFGVAGGDTAAALAAGCPVVVKAHPAHPGTCEWVARAIGKALASTGAPVGTFSLLQGHGHEVGGALAVDPRIAAVAFTGSHAGGRALFDAAARRDRPIPVYAEMGSVNPVLVLPGALARDPQIGETLVASMCLGVGQFCTNPGVILGVAGPELERLVESMAATADAVDPGTMLHPGIRRAFEAGAHARRSARRSTRDGAVPAVHAVDAATFVSEAVWGEEHFGPSTVVVAADGPGQLLEVIDTLPGQLTATVHATADDLATFGSAVDALEARVGRVLFGGVPTGVEVSHAMVHGGPYPATTDARSTSVGMAAIDRFLRPFCWQNAPQGRLPVELRDENPDGLLRLIDGTWSREGIRA
jgi:NADP-dependent aldehyde dehydrogenase